MPILFKKIQKFQVSGKTATTGAANDEELDLDEFGLSEDDYTNTLGTSKYTAEQIRSMNERNAGRRSSKGILYKAGTPIDDIMKSKTFLDNRYMTAASKFKEKIGDDKMRVLAAERARLLKTPGINHRDLTAQLSEYAIKNFGNIYIPKKDIYGDMDMKTKGYLKRANTMNESRYKIREQVTPEIVGQYQGTANTAGTNDADDSDFGWRNFIAPKYIDMMPGYRSLWNTKAPITQEIIK